MLRFLRTPSLRLILILGLLHGLIYIFLVPPWQHYDEPTHFEYAWLIANRSTLPEPGEFDQPMRRAVADSMIKHNFFRGMGFVPDLDARNEAVWIGISQVDDPPFYYLLVSLPLRLLSSWDVTWQLYVGRFVSLTLYLVSLVSAWGIMREFVPTGHPLLWMVPMSMILIPSYTDLMTSVNNDVGSTALFSLFLWGSVRIIQNGFSYRRLLWIASTALLSYWTKNTVLLALPLFFLALLFSLFRGRFRWIPGALLITAIPVILVSMFSWNDALFWIRSPNIPLKNPIRSVSVQSPLGEYVLQLEVVPGKTPPSIFQLLPEDQIISLRGKTVTLGAWIWATQPLAVNAITLYDGRQSFSQAFQIGTSPTFFTLSAVLAADASHAQVILMPNSQDGSGAYTVFYDGLTLVEGTRSTETVPQFGDITAQKGMWGDEAVFTNLLRNASGETAGPGLRSWLEEYKPKFLFTFSPELALGSLLDWRGAGWYYQETAQNLLQTFWAKFGWGHIPLALPFTDQPYSPLAIATFLGLGGAVISLWRRRSVMPWNVLLFLCISLAGTWGQTILRGIHSLAYSWVFIPSARYTYPVIIPTLLALNAGWLEVSHLLGRRIQLSSGVKIKMYFLFFLLLDIASFSTVVHYYYIR